MVMVIASSEYLPEQAALCPYVYLLQVVEAIQSSEDGSTAPPNADISSHPGGYSGRWINELKAAMMKHCRVRHQNNLQA